MRHSCCCWWKRSRWLSKMRYFYSRFQWMTIYLVASNRCVFPQQQNFAMGSLAQISSGAIRCSFYTRFRRSSGSFWCRYPVRFRVPGDVPEGSGEDAWWGSGSFRCRYLVKIPGEVLEGSGADTWWDSGGFPCGEVPEGSAADTWWRSGGFRSRCLVRFRWVLMMMVGEVSEGSRTAAVWKRRWSFQAVVLGIAPEFILATDPLCLTVMILESQSGDLCSPMNPLQSPCLRFDGLLSTCGHPGPRWS